VVLNDFSFRSKKVLFATNGFANNINWVAVKPARAQVLITEPIENLDIKELSIWIGAIIILEILETEYYWVVVGI
jgi:glycine/D-amino acid oxidase-like deaminating enzyme